MRRIGFFGGTFDPPHFGHINLVLSLMEAHNLDQVFVSAANVSPDKLNALPTVSPLERGRMVKLAFDGIDRVVVLEDELKKEGPSYTIEAIKKLAEEYPDDHLFLLLGEDMLEGLDRWKQVDELLEMVTVLVAKRPGSKNFIPASIKNKIDIEESSLMTMDISSTYLRKRLAQKKYCKHLLPTEVLDFIREHGLYSTSL